MLRRSVVCAFLVLNIALIAQADIVAWQHTGTYNPNHFQNTIEITSAGTFGFRGMRDGALAEIQRIWINSNVTGVVSVKIAYDANGGNGATEVWDMDLKTGDSTGRLMVLRCSGPIGQDAPIKADVFGNGVNDPGVFVAGGIPTNKVEIGGGIGYVLINGDCDADLDLGDFNESGGEGDENPYHGAIKITGHLHGNLTAGRGGTVEP